MEPSDLSESLLRLRQIAGDGLLAADADAIDEALGSMERLAAEISAALKSAAGAEAEQTATGSIEILDPSRVGVPDHVRLVAPRDLKRRTWGSPQGRFATLHALAHIEANAVNLALDAVHRFDEMPARYYLDWTRVALEEHGHFGMLCDRLADAESGYGGRYGDLACHNGLWEIAEKTAHDIGARMGLVPMVFEARGLDVTPGLIDRFERHDDPTSAAVLEVVLADEIGHVEVGHRWFGFVCEQRGLRPVVEFERLVAELDLMIVPPFNVDARVAAGFEAVDLARWEASFIGSRGT